MRADVFLMHPLTTASFKPETFPRARASQALALPEVRAAVPVYLAQASWRNPETGIRRAVQLIGFDTEAGVMDFPGLGAAGRRAEAPGHRRLRPPLAPRIRRHGEAAGGARAVRGADRQPHDAGGGPRRDRPFLRRRRQRGAVGGEFPPPGQGAAGLRRRPGGDQAAAGHRHRGREAAPGASCCRATSSCCPRPSWWRGSAATGRKRRRSASSSPSAA